MLKLHEYFRSSASFRVRIALNLKQLSYESIPIHLIEDNGQQFSPAYQALNPHSLVPTLEDDHLILTQSLAIIEYLDERYPNIPLLPSDLYQKSLVRAFALSITADMQPLNNLRVLRYLKEKLKLTEEEKNRWYQHWLALGLTALEKQLNPSTHQDHFCFGNQPTLADICLVPQLYNARRFNCDLTPYPTLVRIDQHCQSLLAFSNAWPMEPVT
jgi:maleylacetoacetate isomerase